MIIADDSDMISSAASESPPAKVTVKPGVSNNYISFAAGPRHWDFSCRLGPLLASVRPGPRGRHGA